MSRSYDGDFQLIAVGKQGSIYLVDRDKMGHFQLKNNNQIVQFLAKAVGGMSGNAGVVEQQCLLRQQSRLSEAVYFQSNNRTSVDHAIL